MKQYVHSDFKVRNLIQYVTKIKELLGVKNHQTLLLIALIYFYFKTLCISSYHKDSAPTSL